MSLTQIEMHAMSAQIATAKSIQQIERMLEDISGSLKRIADQLEKADG